MIVDDEPCNLQCLTYILKSCLKQLKIDPEIVNFIVDEAQNGEEALQLVK